jgi:hypothetical protein
MNYRVVWEIDIEADSPREAAAEALRIQRDPQSIATVFEVMPEGQPGETQFFDLFDLPSEEHNDPWLYRARV